MRRALATVRRRLSTPAMPPRPATTTTPEELVAELSDVVLDTGDIWEVGTVSWPKGIFTQVYDAEGGPKVTKGYPNPFF